MEIYTYGNPRVHGMMYYTYATISQIGPQIGDMRCQTWVPLRPQVQMEVLR